MATVPFHSQSFMFATLLRFGQGRNGVLTISYLILGVSEHLTDSLLQSFGKVFLWYLVWLGI
jgi:hypothetical protein